MLRPYCIAFCFLCSIAGSTAQTSLNPGAYFSAEWFDHFEGDARIAELKKLQDHNYYAMDTIYELGEKQGSNKFSIVKTLLAPYLDEDGIVVHLVPAQAPKFPGGQKALNQYARESLGPYSAGPDDEAQQTVFIRYIIDVDGSIIHVEEAQKHQGWISQDVIVQCIDTVRFMPKWSPGMDRGVAVRVPKMLSFSLK